MKIGIDVRLWNETGVGRYIRELVKNLSKIDKKNNYVLFALSENIDEINNVIASNSFKIVQANFRWHSLEEQLLFSMAIKNEGVDLMHFPYFSVPILYNSLFVVTIHDLILNNFPTGKASTLPFFVYQIKRFAYNAVIDHALNKSSKIIVPLNAVKADILNKFHLNENKIVVTYEGSLEVSDNKRHIITNIPKKYFLHVGNVYPHKNCDRLIKSFKKLTEEQFDVNLLFVGREDYFMKRLKSNVENLNLSKNIVFVGEVTDQELNFYYRQAVGVVIPSLMEGFGLPAIESLTNSSLVLAADIPALREVCGDSAIFFDPYNENDIAESMKKALELSPNKRKELLQIGITHIKQFSWISMAKNTLKIYESCISLR